MAPVVSTVMLQKPAAASAAPVSEVWPTLLEVPEATKAKDDATMLQRSPFEDLTTQSPKDSIVVACGTELAQPTQPAQPLKPTTPATPAAPETPALAPQRAVEHFTFGEELGKGAYATVYKAKCKKTSKHFALKEVVVPRERSLDDIEAEISCSAEFDHPNVLKLHTFFREGRTYHLVFDLCTGGNLADVVAQHTRRVRAYMPSYNSGLPSMQLKKLVPQMMSGLLYLHECGYIHRDVKPHNFLKVSDSSDQVKLCDFGMCRRLQPGDKLTKFCGTRSFMAPEVTFDRYYDTKADVFSLGLTIFALATDSVPTEASTLKEYMCNLQSTLVQSCAWQELELDLTSLVCSMLTLDPSARPSVREAVDSAAWVGLELRRLERAARAGEQPACNPCAVM